MIEVFLLGETHLLIVDHLNKISWWQRSPDSFEAMAARYFYSSDHNSPYFPGPKHVKIMEFYE